MGWRGSALGVGLAGVVASAGPLRVPDDYPTIQEAIDAAGDRDIVLVAPGTYAEAIDLLGKRIVVSSHDPGDSVVVATTVIDPNGLDAPVVTCDSGERAETELRGLTITGGRGRKVGGWHYGAGVYLEASPTIDRCVIRRNGRESGSLAGGGIYVRGTNARPRLGGCRLEANGSGSTVGGAIRATAGARLIGRELTVIRNHGVDGAVAIGKSALFLRECRLLNNSDTALEADSSWVLLDNCALALNFGIGIRLEQTIATINRCELERQHYDGIYSVGGELTLTDTVFFANGRWGCYVVDARHLTMVRCSILGHSSSRPLHIVYYAWGDPVPPVPQVELRNCRVFDNATGDAAVTVSGCRLTLDQCSIFGNWSHYEKAALTLDGSAEYPTVATIRNSIIWGNYPADLSSDAPDSLSVRYSDIGGGGWPGPGNIDADPLFFQSHERAGLLRPASPAIDAGDPRVCDGISDWHPRWPEGYPNGERSDMGALGGPQNWEWVGRR